MTFTKERLEEIAELARKATYKPCAMHMTNLLVVCDSEVIEEMARQLLASMEQDPVAWVTMQKEFCDDERTVITNSIEAEKYSAQCYDLTPLYTAPPAPVSVHDESAIFEAAIDICRKSDAINEHAWNHGVLAVMSAFRTCRAAMLQGADGKPELTVSYGPMPESNGKTNWTAMLHRKGHHPWEGITIDRSEYPGRVRYEADRMRHLIGELADKPDILAYDSDAHSGYVEPVTTAYKLRDAVEIIRNSGIEIDAEKIFAERDVLNTPDCWCRTCRPVTVTDMRFVVCPDCGNKRCPHANDHRNACTGSNEPGQEGSAYPAAPQPAVLSVPAAMEMDDDFDSAFEHGKAVGWNAYRAAMLQAEPASNSDELPPDYLQGHKDGLEWAAQLAEANHPQTGDWLYDDPIELARAIRKGPDMPTVQDGKSPVAPGAWIPVSERMPPEGVPLLICSGNGVVQRTVYVFDGENWIDCYEQYDPVKAEPDHLWQPLPAAPQQEVK